MRLTSSCNNSWSCCLSIVIRWSAMRFNSLTRSFSEDTHSAIRHRSFLIIFMGPCSDNRKWSETSILHNADTYAFSAAVFFEWKLATLTERKEKKTININWIVNCTIFLISHLTWNSYILFLSLHCITGNINSLCYCVQVTSSRIKQYSGSCMPNFNKYAMKTNTQFRLFSISHM